jgi:lysozyme
MSLRDDLIRHEALRLRPYEDSEGILTIGVGRNLEDVGLSEEEVLFMLNNDIERVLAECQHFSWFSGLSQERKDVIANMVFNLGLKRFKKFKKTIAFLASGEFDAAAVEMLDSKWARQVKHRAVELSRRMAKG